MRAWVGKGPKGHKTAQSEPRLSAGESRTTARRPGCSACLRPTPPGSPTLRPSRANFRIHATSQIQSVPFHLSLQFLFLGNPFCAMNSIPSRPGSKVTSLAKPSLTPELPPPTFSPQREPLFLNSETFIFFLRPGPSTCLVHCWCSINACGAGESWRNSGSRAETGCTGWR